MGFIWFWIVAVMIVAYVVLDGFEGLEDLGGTRETGLLAAY